MSEILVYLHYMIEDKEKILRCMTDEEFIKDLDMNLVNKYISSLPYNFLTIFDQKYYQYINNSDNIPLVIYYYGQIDLLGEKTTLLLSDKYPSKYAMESCSDYIRKNDCNYVITTQHGISSQVCASAIVNNKPIIYFVDKSLDSVLTSCSGKLDYIIENGLIISFSCKNKNNESSLFKYYNILHFIKNLVIIEASKKSSINKIVEMSFEHNIDVYALPARIYDYKMSGNNMLIKDGAYMLDLNGY